MQWSVHFLCIFINVSCNSEVNKDYVINGVNFYGTGVDGVNFIV
jgi:hypothetical protein